MTTQDPTPAAPPTSDALTDEAARELLEQHQLAMSNKSSAESDEELQMLKSARNLTPSELTRLLHWLVKREVLLSDRVQRLEDQVIALQAK